jgi:hypothetical protein
MSSCHAIAADDFLVADDFHQLFQFLINTINKISRYHSDNTVLFKYMFNNIFHLKTGRFSIML